MGEHDVEIETAGRRWQEDDVEQRMLAALSAAIGTELVPVTVMVDGATRLEVEGADAEGAVFCQLVANQGVFKSPHRNRVSANLFKLAWLTASVRPGARAILCVTGTAAQAFTSTGWATLAARDLGIELYVVEDDRARPLFSEPDAPGESTR
ncbi:hypothetical protein [Microbacterium tumbae]